METKYSLEIYEPGDDSCVLAFFKSETPFGAMIVGDYITDVNTSKHLKITRIEHILWEVENSHQSHKICVFTTHEQG